PSLQQQFLNLTRGVPREVPPPVDSMDGRCSLPEQAQVTRMTRVSAVGSPEMVRRGLESLLAATDADELIATAQIYDHQARLRSFELAAAVFRAINDSRGTSEPTPPQREGAMPAR